MNIETLLAAYEEGGADLVRGMLAEAGVPDDMIEEVIVQLDSAYANAEQQAEQALVSLTHLTDIYQAEGAAAVRDLLEPTDLPPEAITAVIAQLEQVGHDPSPAAGLNRLGGVLYVFGQLTAALHSLTEAEALHEADDNRPFLALTYHQLGRVHQASEEYDDAYEYYLRALQLRRELDEPREMGFLHFALATLHLELEDADEALISFESALPLFVEGDEPEMEGATCWNMHWLVFEEDRPRAIELVERAAILFETAGNPAAAQFRTRLQELQHE